MEIIIKYAMCNFSVLSNYQRAHPVVGEENSVAGCAFQPVTSGRDARAPRESAAWERGRLARILGLGDELPYEGFLPDTI
jgi:hypothetical protein